MQYFGRCYELCRQLNDPEALHEARVQYGIARGHQHFQSYSHNITTCDDNLEHLIAWKDDRVTASDRSEVREDTGDATGSDPVSESLDDSQPTTT